MATALSAKLKARVIASVDLESLFSTPAFKGLVAFDIYVDKGQIFTGKKVSLGSQSEKEEVTIQGIELKAEIADPNKVRILCSKPKTIQVPLTDGEGWTITEE
jgi:hypothetical protein